MSSIIDIALFQPDIPGNTGTIIRLGACLSMRIHVIGPAGFDLSDRALKRSGMDYLEIANVTRHPDWQAFNSIRYSEKRRLILFTTRAPRKYTDIEYGPSDILLFGRESSGAPEYVHEAVDESVTISMPGGGRSLNLAMSVAMAAGEAMRQIGTGGT